MNATTGFDRAQEDLGNIVEFGHINLCVPDQGLATLFYVSGLGLTRDPYMMTGVDNMWVNAGRNQFHLPTHSPNIIRGTIGLVVPDLDAVLSRFAAIGRSLQATAFRCDRRADFVALTCPWGNRFHVHAPDVQRFGPVSLGIAYVEFGVAADTALDGIVGFYRDFLDGTARMATDAQGEHASVSVGADTKFLFRHTDSPLIPFDGHHVQIAVADFSGPHRKLQARGLVSEESSQHQYRFQDIVDPRKGKLLFTLEHEVRSMKHPMYARPLVNRHSGRTTQNFVPGAENWPWAMP